MKKQDNFIGRVLVQAERTYVSAGLERGGADMPDNMQWQTIEEAKDKDK